MGWNKLTKLDAGIFQGSNRIEKIDFESNLLTECNLFQGLGYLKEIDLRRNKMQKFELNVFKNMPVIETINLSNNELLELDANIFQDNLNLSLLDISQNKLKSLDSNTFRGLNILQRVYLHGNQLHEKMEIYLEKSVVFFTVRKGYNDNDVRNVINLRIMPSLIAASKQPV